MFYMGFLVAQMVKNLPAMQETGVWSLCWEDSLEKGMADHSSSLVWRIPWTEEPAGLLSMGSQWVRHSWKLTHTVQFSCSVVSDSLPPHEPQHARPHCPSPTPRVQPNPCPLSRWCHPTISSSVVPFSSCPQSFPASGSFQMSQFFTSGHQSIGVSASASVLPMNIQDWFPLRWTGWISLQSRDSQDSSPTPQFKSINPLALSFLYWDLAKCGLWKFTELWHFDLCASCLYISI